jgi:hypothetical protein
MTGMPRGTRRYCATKSPEKERCLTKTAPDRLPPPQLLSPFPQGTGTLLIARRSRLAGNMITLAHLVAEPVKWAVLGRLPD